MSSRSKQLFDKHIHECTESISIHEHLENKSGFSADFSLRFVWIAAVSSIDHYISQVIIEKATENFSNGVQLQSKLLSDTLTFAHALELHQANPVMSVLVFKKILSECIRYNSFQQPSKIADGLSYIWPEKHKWNYISQKIGSSEDATKRKLSSIVDRRNLIAHNADYDEGRGEKLSVNREDAKETVAFITRIVEIVDGAIS